MKLLSLLLIVLYFINFINADVYTNSYEFGSISKGKLITQKYVNIGLPSTNFNLEGIQVVILNKTSGQPFDHAYISTCAVDFTSNGRKIVSFTASNINNQLVFPAPYLVPITDNLNLTISMYTLNKIEENITISYYIKWDQAGSNTVVKLTRTATSVVANFSSFNVPAGSGSGFTIQNSIVWTSGNAEVVNFQSTVSPGIISMSFIEQLNGENTVICQSTPTYIGKVLIKMSNCDNVVSLYKGATYVTQAVYNDTTALRGVFGTLSFYAGYPQPSTTSSSSSSSSHSTTTTGGSGSTTHASTTGGSGSTTHGSNTGGGSTGGSSSHGSTGGGSHGSTGGSSSSSSSHATSGHSTSQSESSESQGSQSGSESDSSFTTTTGASSEIPPDDSSNGGYTSGTSGSSGTFIWNGNQARKVEIF